MVTHADTVDNPEATNMYDCKTCHDIWTAWRRIEGTFDIGLHTAHEIISQGLRREVGRGYVRISRTVLAAC